MATERYQFFDVHPVGGVVILRVEVPMIRQPQAAQDFGAEVRLAIQSHQPRAVLIDLAAVEYLSSTGFAVLLSLAKTVTESGASMALCGLQEDVARGSSILGLQRFLRIYENEKEALDALDAAPQNE
jgi:anti-anti-sigma factor